MGTQQVPDPGKTPPHSARFAPARKSDPATSPRPALYADSFPKLDAIGACRQDVVQISLTYLPFVVSIMAGLLWVVVFKLSCKLLCIPWPLRFRQREGALRRLTSNQYACLF